MQQSLLIRNKCKYLTMFQSKSKKKYSGWPGDCSQDQLKALGQFREFVIELNDGKINPRWDDQYLLRFLRARKFKPEETRVMWKNFITWRTEKDIDNALKFKFPELIELRKNYPHGYHKVDRQGRPVYIERVGFLKIDEIFKFTTEERLLRYYAASYETLLTTIFDSCTEFHKKSTGEDKRICQSMTILDLSGVSLGDASKTYGFVKPASQMAQDNYPEILGNMYIVNAPFLFTGIWAIVRMWVDQKTRDKVKILGGSYKKELLEKVAPENLPSFFKGGLCKCEEKDGYCLSQNVGPWNPEGEELFPGLLGEENAQMMQMKK